MEQEVLTFSTCALAGCTIKRLETATIKIIINAKPLLVLPMITFKLELAIKGYSKNFGCQCFMKPTPLPGGALEFKMFTAPLHASI